MKDELPEQIWYVWISGAQKGPYSIAELKAIPELTPDTWAWREGMTAWMPIRSIPELKELFEEVAIPEEVETPAAPEEEGVIALPDAQPPWFFWFLLLVITIIYAFFLLTRS